MRRLDTEARRFAALVAALGVLAVGMTLRSAPTTYVVDNRFDQYWAPARRLRGSLGLWDPSRSLGRVREDLWPAATIGPGLLRFLGASPAVAEHLWHSALLLCGGWAIAALLREFRPKVGAEHLLAAVLYMFGPYSATFLVPSNLYLHYSLAPLFVLAVYKGLTGDAPWRWAGVFALCVFAAGNVDVPGLVYALIPAVLAALYVIFVVHQTSRARVVRWFGGTFALCLAANAATLYKIANGYGAYSQNLGGTETATDVSRNSSWAESWRGMGFWLSYFQERVEWARPQGIVFMNEALVVLATFAVPIVAVIAYRRIHDRMRILALAMMVVSVVLMVGAFPVGRSTPYGRLLLWLYDEVPGTLAFRNSYKAGAGLALGGALLVATGVADGLRALRARDRRLQTASIGGVLLVLAPLTYPFWSGNLYDETRTVDDIPSYVTEAYRWIDEQPDDDRLLVVPGSSYTAYRWGNVGDDVHDAFLDRWHAVRTSVLQSTPPASDVTDAIDDYLRSGSVRPGVVPAMAARLGMRYIVVRNDLDWQRMGTPRPSELAALRSDPGLTLLATFGQPGVNTTDPSDGSVAATAERALRPIEIYGVTGVDGPVRVTDRVAPTIVSGNGDAWPQLAEQGLLDQMPSIEFSGSLDADELTAALTAGAPVVVTDGNRRRSTLLLPEPERSHTLAADEDLGRDAPDAFTRPGSQTVVDYGSASRIWDSRQSTGLSGFVPSARPSRATDGDALTAWLVSAIDQPLGAALRIDFASEQLVREVVITRAEPPVGGRAATSARVVFSNGFSTDVFLTRGPVRIEVPLLAASWVDIAPTSASGPGDGPIGFAEVSFPGLDLSERVVVPTDVVRAASADPRVATALAAVPMHFSFARQRSGGLVPEERSLHRTFSVDSERRYRVEGLGSVPSFATDPTSQLLRTMLSPGRGGLPRCTGALVSLDGQPVPVRVALVSTAGDGTLRFSMSSCRPVLLGAATHDLDTANPTVLDDVVLRDQLDPRPATAATPPAAAVASVGRTSVDLAVTAPDGGVLTFAQAFDPAWRLEIDGTDLGPPRAVDGVNGWTLAAGTVGVASLRYPAETDFRQILGISLTAVLLALGLAVLGTNQLLPARSFVARSEERRVGRAATRAAAQVAGTAVVVFFGGWLGLVPATLLFARWSRDIAGRAALVAAGSLGVAAVATLLEAPLRAAEVADYASARPVASAFGRLAAMFLVVAVVAPLLPARAYRPRAIDAGVPADDDSPSAEPPSVPSVQAETSDEADTRSITVGASAS